MAPKKAEEKKPEPAVIPSTNVGLARASDATPLVTNSAMPAWLQQEMKGKQALGLEKLDSTDIIYPRIVLCQGLTPAVADGLRKSGDIMDNLTTDLFAEQGTKLQFIPIVMSKSRIMLKPKTEGGGILCRSDDAIEARTGGQGLDQGGNYTRNCADCVLKEWNDAAETEAGRKPKCAGFYNVMGLLPEFGYRAVVWSGKSTQVKVFKRFLSICKVSNAHLFAMKFNLFAINQESNGHKFKNWDFESLGWVSASEYNHARGVYESMSGKTWSANVEDLEKDGDIDDTGHTPPPAAESNAQAPF